MFALLLSLAAQASSLDVIAVGGSFGSPGATDASAVFWNPAGLAVGDGTQINLEVAPTFATINMDLSQGRDTLQFNGIVPFLAVSSDFTHKPLGVGISLSVPQARGGVSTSTPPEDAFGPGGGAARLHIKEGGSQVIMASAAASYQIKDVVAFGGGFHFVHSTWAARLDIETLTALNEGLCEGGFCDNYRNDDGTYQNELVEDPDYAAELRFKDLKDNTFTFSGGVYITPIEQLGISVSYMHSGRLTHTGPVSAHFGCPPESDNLGRFAAGLSGLCNANMTGAGTIAYNMPWRLHMGLVGTPIDSLRLELMGAVVGHSVFTDYDITTVMDPDSIDTLDEDQEEERIEAASRASQVRQWARDNRNSFFVGVDAKGKILDDKLTLGGRVTFDKAAVPIEVLGPNNIDFDEIILSPMVAFSPIEQLEIGLSYSRHIMLPRTNSNSLYNVSLEHDNGIEDRYFYTNTNGTYSGGINRVGVSIRSRFGG